jgi:predicted RNase H-like HicB family nuclease
VIFEVPELLIRQVEGRYVAVCGNAEIPLPIPEQLRERAVGVCRSWGDEEAAEALRACDLSYAVAQGQGIEQLIEVVIAAPEGVFEALQEHRSPLIPGIMGALLEVCPDLGSDRVVLKK